MVVLDTVVDTAELRELHNLVVAELSRWVDGTVKSEAIDR